MNYFTYPMKNMRITQDYDGNTSHKPHWYNVTNYKDYPIDDGGLDGGKEGIYCPCDEMIVTAIKGIGNSATNTIWLVSTTKVKTPTFEDYAFMTLTHSDDIDFKNISLGKKYKRGELIVYEGTDGATANHIHMVFGRGTSDNWIENNNRKWVMTGDTKKPEEVCYIDSDFTKIHNTGGIEWKLLIKYVGNTVERDEQNDQIEILVDNLRVRTTPEIKDNNIIGYIKKGIYNIIEVKTDNEYIWYKVDTKLWIAYNPNWAIIYNKKEEGKPSILKKIIALIKKIICKLFKRKVNKQIK